LQQQAGYVAAIIQVCKEAFWKKAGGFSPQTPPQKKRNGSENVEVSLSLKKGSSKAKGVVVDGCPRGQ